MALNGEKTNLCSVKNSYKTMMNTVAKDTSLKFLLSILKNHTSYSAIYYPFLLERMKIDKCEKLACSLYYKENYVRHIKVFKQTW